MGKGRSPATATTETSRVGLQCGGFRLHGGVETDIAERILCHCAPIHSRLASATCVVGVRPSEHFSTSFTLGQSSACTAWITSIRAHSGGARPQKPSTRLHTHRPRRSKVLHPAAGNVSFCTGPTEPFRLVTARARARKRDLLSP